MKELALFMSLGFTVITPLLISIYLSIMLKNRYNLPEYTIIIGVLLGILCGVFSVYKVIKGWK